MSDANDGVRNLVLELVDQIEQITAMIPPASCSQLHQFPAYTRRRQEYKLLTIRP